MHRVGSGRQAGMTLIEVLISVLILAVGLLGAAAIQLNALKYTDSSLMTSQASFIAYDMLDRIRANPDANYVVNSLQDVTATAGSTAARDADLYDFKNNISNFAATDGSGSISINNRVVTITIGWGDRRADSVTTANAPTRTFVLTSRVGTDPVVTP
ncbi:type IV pilus modification protein PilV [Pseudomonas gingeri]|uniref:Type IV pilus modification protein PilV n=1 Tax=Pseudomonas gingeri TaxID=117681 RepID=A0A7Y7YBW1_9PSED|nr:type IV pilus modification protein PilV [Pseudomonas gingeri]NWB25389.1 type IV pilus modification protein PilV [Pseudomonas gingeri]NWC33430.1 type IV pilus modification protein PilV [Pseudomonas gingeri]NWD52143.1 type IV pilus modification protein PilV [Pseudomonas gingeri]